MKATKSSSTFYYENDNLDEDDYDFDEDEDNFFDEDEESIPTTIIQPAVREKTYAQKLDDYFNDFMNER